MTKFIFQFFRPEKLSIISLLVFYFSTAHAQRDEQLWLEFQFDYPFANKYLFEISAAYQTLLTEDRWRSVGLSPTFEYVLFTRLDLTAELPIAYTMQQEGTTSFELAPLVGFRFHITQNKRIDTRFIVRYQQRYFRQVEDEDWDISNRTRLRGEIWISINRPNLFNDNLWYTFLDYEEFIVLDEQLDERYANRRRGRIGVGYRLNYKNRFEIAYTLVSSRNEIEGEFNNDDNVIQLRYKMFLNPAKPVQPDE